MSTIAPLAFPKVIGDASKMTNDEWLAARHGGIGGSDAGAILGVSPWSSPLQLWKEKVAAIPESKPPSEAMAFGSYAEPWIAQQFSVKEGFELIDDTYIYQHPDRFFMLANIDRRTVTDALVEIKTSRQTWDSVPANYYAQIQHYLAVTNMDYAFLAVMFANSFSITTFDIERDDFYIEQLIEAESAFWQQVLSGTPPEMDGSKADYDMVRKSWEAKAGKVIALPDSVQALIAEREEAKTVQDAAEKRVRLADAKLMDVMKDAEIGTYNGKNVITWKNTTTNRIDAKKLRDEHPDIADEFTTSTSYRTLRVATWPS